MAKRHSFPQRFQLKIFRVSAGVKISRAKIDRVGAAKHRRGQLFWPSGRSQKLHRLAFWFILHQKAPVLFFPVPGAAVQSVSYTHLDVYKRQPYDRLNFARSFVLSPGSYSIYFVS